MEGLKANLVITDPPYNVNYEGGAGKIKNDNMENCLLYTSVLLTKCAELWVFGDTVSKGMGIEIEKAKRKGQTIRYFTENCQEVSV